MTNKTLKEFGEGTLNNQIFQLTAPYNNPYQGNDPRWLFVCSAGLLRSPTAAAIAIKRGMNARACGSNPDYALIPLSANLIMWADRIFFVNEENYEQALQTFEGTKYYQSLVAKATVWNLPDVYPYGNEELVELIEQNLFY